jgi:hypothetical protein
MKNHSPTNRIWSLSSAAVCIAMVLAMSAVAGAKSPKLPEVSEDGLHLMKKSKVRVAYVKPGATLDKYTKVILVDCYVDFKEDWAKDYNLNSVGLKGMVQNKDVSRIKRQTADFFREVFVKELEKRGYAVVDTSGPEVLVLRPALVNLVVAAPDLDGTNAFGSVFVPSHGQVTLFLELYDSVSDEIIARVIDPRADTIGGRADRLGNKAAADRIFSRWAKLLVKNLGEVKGQ